MQKEIYKSNCDLNFVAKIITCLFIFSIFFLSYFLPEIEEYKLGYYTIIGILIVTATYAWGIHPQKFILTSDELIVVRPFKNAKFNCTSISHVEDISDNFNVNIRSWGSRGLFGFFGYFFSAKINWYYLYAGNYELLILIKFNNGKKIVINPSDYEFYKKLVEHSKS